MSGAGSAYDLQIIYLNSELIDIGKCAFRDCKRETQRQRQRAKRERLKNEKIKKVNT